MKLCWEISENQQPHLCGESQLEWTSLGARLGLGTESPPTLNVRLGALTKMFGVTRCQPVNPVKEYSKL